MKPLTKNSNILVVQRFKKIASVFAQEASIGIKSKSKEQIQDWEMEAPVGVLQCRQFDLCDYMITNEINTMDGNSFMANDCLIL